MARFALGVDIGGTKIAAAVVDDAGVMRGRQTVTTPAAGGASPPKAVSRCSLATSIPTYVLEVGVLVSIWLPPLAWARSSNTDFQVQASVRDQ